MLAVHEAVKRLEEDDPRKGQIVNLRYFARLTTAETATALGVSVGTVEREWRYIRAWLQRELTTSERDDDSPPGTPSPPPAVRSPRENEGKE